MESRLDGFEAREEEIIRREAETEPEDVKPFEGRAVRRTSSEASFFEQEEVNRLLREGEHTLDRLEDQVSLDALSLLRLHFR